MDITDLKHLLDQAADGQGPPSPTAQAEVVRRARRHRRNGRVRLLSAGAILCAGLAVGVIELEPHNPSQTVSTSASGGGGGGEWGIGPAKLAVLHDYQHPDGQFSAVSKVELKETTWANYVVWARNQPDAPLSGGYLGSGPHSEPMFSALSKIYIITQVGDFNCNTIYGCHGRTYSWVLDVIGIGDTAGGGLVWSSPVSATPPSLASIPGPDAVLDTVTGHITSTSSPAPGLPTIPVPSVVGRNLVAAVTDLQNLGFSSMAPDQVPIVLGAPPDKRRVTTQDPPAGTAAPAGSTVVLTFSS